jgi:ribosomal protein S18 acetylase RimI-like enzyme
LYAPLTGPFTAKLFQGETEGKPTSIRISVVGGVIGLVQGITIRAPHDEEKRVFYDVFQSGLPGVDRMTFEGFAKWWDESLGQGTLPQLWRVAEARGRIVGIVVNMMSPGLKSGMIWELAVLPKWRSKGIGTQLLQESERILTRQDGTLTHFVLSTKTWNLKALRLYERFGYSIHSVILHLQGSKAQLSPSPDVQVRKASSEHVAQLCTLTPGAVWSTRSQEGWSREAQDLASYVVLAPRTSRVLGYFRTAKEEELEASTLVAFAFQPGQGPRILDASVGHIETNQMDLWIQDSHQDVIEYLYDRQFTRVDAEYLLKKAVPK